MQCDCMLKLLQRGHTCYCSACLQVLNANGVQKLTAELGQKLDPNQHEAMFDIPNPDAEPGTIAVIVKVGDMPQAFCCEFKADSLSSHAQHTGMETQASMHAAININSLGGLLIS